MSLQRDRTVREPLSALPRKDELGYLGDGQRARPPAPAAPLLEHSWNFRLRDGVAEQVSLRFAAAFLSQPGKLLDRFHAFRRGSHIESLAQTQDRTHNSAGTVGQLQVPDE